MSKEIIVVASRHFEIFHHGHLNYLQLAKKLGDKLIVIVSNDRQAKLKKGSVFMTAKERIQIIREFKCVDFVIEAVDDDPSVCKTLALLHPDIFAKGGDRTIDNIPETDICKQLGIKIVDGLGEKIQSSRTLMAGIEKMDKHYLY